MSRFAIFAVSAIAALAVIPAAAEPATVSVQGFAPSQSNNSQLRAIRLNYETTEIAGAGAQALFDRIQTAATKVCSSPDGRAVPPSLTAQFERCRTKAVTEAVGKVDIAALSQLAAKQ